MGFRLFTKVAQVLKPTLLLEPFSITQELMVGILVPRRGQTKEVMVMTGWSLEEGSGVATPMC